MKQSEIDRALVLVYRSNNAHDYTNWTKPCDAMDKLPMIGLEEYARSLEVLRNDVLEEIERRKAIGQVKFSVDWYAELEARRAKSGSR